MMDIEKQQGDLQVEGGQINPSPVPVFTDALEVTQPPHWLRAHVMELDDNEVFRQIELLELAEDFDEREQEQLANIRDMCATFSKKGVGSERMRVREAKLLRQWLYLYRIRRWQRYLLAGDDTRRDAESRRNPLKAQRWEAERIGYNRLLHHGNGWHAQRRHLTVSHALSAGFETFAARVKRLEQEWTIVRHELEIEKEKREALERKGSIQHEIQQLVDQIMALPKRNDESLH